MGKIKITESKYPYLATYGEKIEHVARMPLGREEEVMLISDNLSRPEMNNVALLAPAGSGKTALLEGYAVLHKDDGTEIFKINLPAMNGEGQDKFADNLIKLSEEVERYVIDREKIGEKGDVVVFFDEMHLLTFSGESGTGGGSVAGNALKPLMARGEIKIIGATTDEEFRRYVQQDAALTRRFQVINVEEVDDLVTVKILISFAKKYLGKGWQKSIDKKVLKEIVVYTNRYLLDQAQPAKSIDILDGAIGRFNNRNEYIDHAMIADIFKHKYNIDVDWHTDIKTVHEKLHKRVMGQDLAIRMLEDRLFVANAGLQDHSRPLANFLFTGSTGVGKTELAKGIADAMFGNEKAMVRFDMSEFSESADVHLFQQRVTDEIRKHPFTVLLIDEFEKAARTVMNLLLPVLDDGHLSDRYNRLVPFNNCIVILTSNAAADVFKDAKNNGLSNSEVDGVLRAALGDRFSPEFLGRFDKIIPFNVLDEQSFKNIARIQLNKQRKRVYSLYGCEVIFRSVIEDYLVYENFDALDNSNAGGGRAMSRRIESEISPLLAKAVDSAKSRPETLKRIIIDMKGDAAFQHKDLRVGSAYLEASFVMLKEGVDEKTVTNDDFIVGVIDNNSLDPEFMSFLDWNTKRNVD